MLSPSTATRRTRVRAGGADDEGAMMRILPHVLRQAERVLGVETAAAHCDLPCGVYDPAQARIEAESVLQIMEKMADADPDLRTRSILIKEQRAELVKHHLWVLWTDY